jgi:transposase
MIVIGADTHKRTHTCAAARAGTGEIAGEKTAAARKPRFHDLLDWARELDSERIWALEDCRHVSGSFERFLVGQGSASFACRRS